MGTDTLSIVAPARIKVEKVVQLGDVSPDSRPHRTTFSPLAFPAGRVLFDLRTSAPPASHLALCPFEIYRQHFIIVGVADGKHYEHSSDSSARVAEGNGKNGPGSTLSEKSIQSLLDHREELASAFSTALVHQTIVFDCNVSNQGLPKGLTAVPSIAKSKTTTIKTVMCDLTSQLLAEMASFARSLQELPSIETPKVPRQNVQRPLARYSASSGPLSTDPSQPTLPTLNDPERNEHRMSMPAHLLANLGPRSSTPESRPTSPPNGRGSPPAALDGTSSTPASPPSRLTDRQRPMSRDRASMQGFGSNSLSERERTKSRGRTHIVIGSLYLLAGRWPDAVKEIVDGATVAKINSDHVWHAKALDYLLVICLLYAWSNLDFRIPPLLHAATDKTGPSLMKASKETPMSSHANLATDSATPSWDASLQSLSHILPELVTTVQNLYSRAWTFSEDRIPQLAFSETGLRFSRLLVVADSSDGKITYTNLHQIVLGSQAYQLTAVPERSSISPRRIEIAAFLFRSFPSTDTDDSMTTADRTMILAGTASILADLGYRRKQAYVLKELLQGLVPALVEARKRGAAEMGVHPAASLASMDAALVGARGTASEILHGQDEAGIQSFLLMVCRMYGIYISPGYTDDDRNWQNDKPKEMQPATAEPFNVTERIIQRTVPQASSKFFGSMDLKIEVLRLCINVCEALPDLEGVLQYSVELLRTSGSGIAPGSDDSHGSPSLSIEDQLRLWNNISRTVGVGRQLGLECLAAEYWDDFLVRGIELAPSTSDTPIPHEKGELDTVTMSKTDTSSGPFLYNPFGPSSKAKVTKPLMIAGEEAVFRVTLQNLYDFDLEVESIRLTPDAENCDTPTQSAVVGPYRTQSIYLTAIPSQSGSLSISGCVAKIRGCGEQWFPLFCKPWSYRPNIKALESGYSALLSGRPPQDTEKRDVRAIRGPAAASIDLDVITALPNVFVKAVSLPQSAMMLLEGETKAFTITLCNSSKFVAADLVVLMFEDSTAAQLKAAMSNKELPAADLHELALAASKKPFKWRQTADESSPTIKSGQELTLDIELTSQAGLSNAVIQILYGHLGVPQNQLKDRFYTRQISVPLTVTVNASVDVTRTDILPFSAQFAWQNQQKLSSQSRPPSAKKLETPTDKLRRHSSTANRMKITKTVSNENRFQSLLSRIGLSPTDKAHCLLCLDCRNSWPTPLSISIQVRPPPTPNTNGNNRSSKSDFKLAYTVHESLQPGHTKRILLLLPRLRLPNAHLPIPSLDPKQQFIVSSSPKVAYEAQLAARESYWYREAVLDRLHATWTEESILRTGVINLRNIRLSERMINALKLPELEIEMELALTSASDGITDGWKAGEATKSAGDVAEDDTPSHDIDTSLLRQIGPTTYAAPLSQALTLTTIMTNHSASPIHPLLRLQPLLKPLYSSHPHHIALDTSRKLMIHGLLQQVLPVLQPGERRTVDIGVCVLGMGTWSIGGVVEEVRILTDGEDGTNEERERRLWTIEEGLEIIGVEEHRWDVDGQGF
ncbi:MAG: hypothetical protein Q9186_001110 [Xanthomendoza sp. 1 TL-2023]